MKDKQYFNPEEHALICRECGGKQPINDPIELYLFDLAIANFAIEHKDCERNLYRPLAD